MYLVHTRYHHHSNNSINDHYYVVQEKPNPEKFLEKIRKWKMDQKDHRITRRGYSELIRFAKISDELIWEYAKKEEVA